MSDLDELRAEINRLEDALTFERERAADIQQKAYNLGHKDELEDLRAAVEDAESRADDAERYMRKTVREIEQNIRSGFAVRFDLLSEELARTIRRSRSGEEVAPERGDLVLETTTYWPTGSALGVLVEMCRETRSAKVKNLATGVVESWGNARFVQIIPAKDLNMIGLGLDPPNRPPCMNCSGKGDVLMATGIRETCPRCDGRGSSWPI